MLLVMIVVVLVVGKGAVERESGGKGELAQRRGRAGFT